MRNDTTDMMNPNDTARCSGRFEFEMIELYDSLSNRLRL